MMLASQSMRVFGFASSSRAPFSEKFIKLDDNAMMHSLMERQRKFDSNPVNSRFAYKYFRELNRHQKFETVRRLYEKHETDYRIDAHADFDLQDKVTAQYNYAI
jgi:ATP-dependent Zn protease